MPDNRLYRDSRATLGSLLSEMSAAGGATLLLPDLQRDFVWDPGRITLLVDSLLKGWPSGTVLLWRLDEDQAALPGRCFWTVDSRVADQPGNRAVRRNPPGAFRMVLDGQQRLQSLLLALGGNAFGMRMQDRAWREALTGRRAHGRAGAGWTKAELCLDVRAYSDELRAAHVPRRADHTKTLAWAVCGPNATQPARAVDDPVPVAARHPGRYIRLSELWDLAQPMGAGHQATVDAIQAKPWGVADADANGLAELVALLADLKSQELGVVELCSQREAGNNGISHEEYGDAVVNIFARLNQGGVSLTRDELTFSWIKNCWSSAQARVSELTRGLGALGVRIKGTEDLVGALTVVWAGAAGQPLAPRDLLDGAKVAPLAAWLDANWARVERAILDCAGYLHREHGLAYPRDYQSLNALAVLTAWYYLCQRKSAEAGLDMQRNDAALLREHALRWMALTTWAGEWQARGSVLSNYLEELGKSRAEPESCMVSWLSRPDFQDRGAAYIEGLAAQNRAQTRRYLLPLCAWNASQPGRHEISKKALGWGRGALASEVDHIVSVRLFERIRGDAVVDGARVNALGNCMLLHKNFNIAKRDEPLEDFLRNANAPPEFCRDLAIPPEMCRPSRLDAVVSAIESRTAAVKKDITAFIRGGPSAAGSAGQA